MADKIEKIDMSSKAIDLRLRQLAGIRKLGISLLRATPSPVNPTPPAPPRTTRAPIGNRRP